MAHQDGSASSEGTGRRGSTGRPGSTARSATKQGLIDIWPMLVPAVPFGLVYGVLISEAETSTFWGWVASPLVMAGASQLTLVTLIDEGAAVTAALASALIVNARHLMYSAALSPLFGPQPKWFRFAGSFWLVDQLFALISLRPDDGPAFRRRYWTVMGLAFWATWVVMTSVGVLFGGAIPADWQVEFAVSILFLSLVIDGLDENPSYIAAGTGFLVAAASGPVPNRLGLLIGALTGIAAGTMAEMRTKQVAS